MLLRIESSRGYGRDLLKGIARYARLHTNWSFYREPPYYRTSGGLKTEIERIKKWRPTGIIVRQAKGIRELMELKVPIIISHNVITSSNLRKKLKDVPSIATDCLSIGEMSAEYLLNKGFKNFAFCGFNEMDWSSDRFEGFSKRIQKADFETHQFKTSNINRQYDWEDEISRMADYLKSIPKPLAVMACNDDRGLDVIKACRMAGLFVPEEVAVIGVDNDETACEISNPPLTSVAINAERAGYEASELLDKMMLGKKVIGRHITVKPMFVVSRQSTDVLAIEDETVAESVNYIRQNIRKPLQVTDVVEAVAISRRSLEKKFNKTLGRSVLAEIKRLKVAQIAQMLLETNLTITEIARQFNFPDVHNISRYFRKETNMSLFEYRKKYGTK